MKSRAGALALLIVVLTQAVPPAGAQTAAPPPVEKLFARPAFNLARLSPNGRWLANAVAPAPGKRVGLQIIDLDGKESSLAIELSASDDVSWFRWVNDDWLIFQMESPTHRGAERLGEGLVAVRRDGTGSRMLIGRLFEPEQAIRSRARYLAPDHFYLAAGPVGSTEIIVGQLQFREGQYSHLTPKVMDVTTGAVRTMLEGAPRAGGWLFDARGRARLAWHQAEGQITTHWADKDGRWRVISKAPTLRQPFVALAPDGDDGLLVETAAPGDGSSEIRRFDFATGQPESTPLFTTPGFDTVEDVVADRSSGRVLGLKLVTDGPTQVWMSAAMKALQAKVDARFPNNVNIVQCSPCDGSGRLLVFTYSDTDPGSYVLYEPRSDKWSLVGELMPGLDLRAMAPLEFQRFKARDGHEVPVWITRPKGAGSQPAPAVVLVHGGPWQRGREWGFSAEAQFLASRGYVVIEPEFRGSKGYGEAHYRAGWKQWGRAMQDDISDALKFAVKQGWADGRRACIMGASYGGYATLMGLAKDPDQYRCGVAYAAVVDPRLMFDFYLGFGNNSFRKFELPDLLGDPVKDADMLKAAAPVEQADRIKAPVLLAHGGRDGNVPIEHGERMRQALIKAGKSVEWVEYGFEGHSFFYDENRFDFYRRVEAFLAKHLKP
ncbi:MAG: S9 family peptidase [Rubrivivax sp.]|nr:S9 family peptidase [Rubrivivax sp.]